MTFTVLPDKTGKFDKSLIALLQGRAPDVAGNRNVEASWTHRRACASTPKGWRMAPGVVLFVASPAPALPRNLGIVRQDTTTLPLGPPSRVPLPAYTMTCLRFAAQDSPFIASRLTTRHKRAQGIDASWTRARFPHGFGSPMIPQVFVPLTAGIFGPTMAHHGHTTQNGEYPQQNSIIANVYRG